MEERDEYGGGYGLPEEEDPSRAMGGAEPLLSAEESEALLQAIRSASFGEETAQRTELGAADAPMRRALRTADVQVDALVLALEDTLIRSGMAVAEIVKRPSAVTPYEALTQELAPTAATWEVVSGPLAPGALPLALIAIGPALTSALLERRLGAPEMPAGMARPGPQRPPSALERRVLEPTAKELANAVLPAFVGTDIACRLAPRRSSDADANSRFAPCLRIGAAVTLRDGASSEVLIALFAPAFTPRPVPGKDVEMRAALADVEVEIIAFLGRAKSTVRGLLALEVGSVIRLDGAPDRPVELRVDGVPVLRGMPMVQDGNLAIEVKS